MNETSEQPEEDELADSSEGKLTNFELKRSNSKL